MKVPGSWWDNISDSSENELHAGKIHSINFDPIETQNYWRLQLDDVNERDLYSMRHDAILQYADETYPLCSSIKKSIRLV